MMHKVVKSIVTLYTSGSTYFKKNRLRGINDRDRLLHAVEDLRALRKIDLQCAINTTVGDSTIFNKNN